ncbi:hypothetical protein [Undibacterium squillarum]|nr:hypothetical protein [Undibacterium squillarum]
MKSRYSHAEIVIRHFLKLGLSADDRLIAVLKPAFQAKTPVFEACMA